MWIELQNMIGLAAKPLLLNLETGNKIFIADELIQYTFRDREDYISENCGTEEKAQARYEEIKALLIPAKPVRKQLDEIIEDINYWAKKLKVIQGIRGGK